MRNELEIEKLIADYLQGQISEYDVESFNTDMLEIVQRAKGHSKGLVVISHSNQPATYEPLDESATDYMLTEEYVATILVNDRQSREELYDLFQKVRTALLGLEIDGRLVKLSRHRISPQKFPDLQEGVHIAEVEIIIRDIFSQRRRF